MRLGLYLLFDGTCAEAMEFYRHCLGGELVTMRVKDSLMKEQIHPALSERVVQATLTAGEIELSASDWLHPTRKPKQGNTVCAYVSGATDPELSALFARLCEGADPALVDQLRPMPFGTYGALTDKYGVRWMFSGSGK